MLSLSKASNPFLEILQYFKTKFLQYLDLSFCFIFVYDILPTTKVTGLTAMKNLGPITIPSVWLCWRKYKKIMTTQQRRYLLLSYFNNKINFLFSWKIRSWSLRFREFDICQVSTAQSNTLVHSIVTNKWVKFGAKIFRHLWDIAIFMLGCFILPHPVFPWRSLESTPSTSQPDAPHHKSCICPGVWRGNDVSDVTPSPVFIHGMIGTMSLIKLRHASTSTVLWAGFQTIPHVGGVVQW